MIDRLENCPNCGAILDDTGRCNFCGSKVYDLFDIDVSGKHGVKYLRIKTDKGILLAPIVYNTVTMEMNYYSGTIIGIELMVIGDVIYENQG